MGADPARGERVADRPHRRVAEDDGGARSLRCRWGSPPGTAGWPAVSGRRCATPARWSPSTGAGRPVSISCRARGTRALSELLGREVHLVTVDRAGAVVFAEPVSIVTTSSVLEVARRAGVSGDASGGVTVTGRRRRGRRRRRRRRRGGRPGGRRAVSLHDGDRHALACPRSPRTAGSAADSGWGRRADRAAATGPLRR